MLNRFLAIIIVATVSFFGWYLISVQPVSPQNKTEQTFEIPQGASLNQIIGLLSSQRLIRSRTAFKITATRLGIQNKLQAGFFKLSPSMSATQIAQSLTKAFAEQIRITIPEGLRAEEINFILEKEFSQVKGSQYNPSDFASLTKNFDGNLFPDTYYFSPTASAKDIYNKLTARFEEVSTELKISDQDLSKVLIIASLLEREAASSQEMPQIAGVINNRLSASWPLQIDATVQYALASKLCKKLDCQWWKPGLTIDDLDISSPYNTYKNQGLPPSPISNPGKDALNAANKPASTSAWFYIHDLNGQIHFSQTVEEHNKNVCTYLKKCN